MDLLYMYILCKSLILTLKGVNERSKYVTQVQQQRPQSSAVTLIWHACRYKEHKLYQKLYIPNNKKL